MLAVLAMSGCVSGALADGEEALETAGSGSALVSAAGHAGAVGVLPQAGSGSAGASAGGVGAGGAGGAFGALRETRPWSRDSWRRWPTTWRGARTP